MRILTNHREHEPAGRTAPGRAGARLTGKRAGFSCLVLLTLLATYNLSSQQQESAPSANTANGTGRPADPKAQAALQQQPPGAKPDAPGLERKRQITDDSARLLKLASDLRTEVDKTSKDTLSLGVIRKADEIEKLARNVKEKMKLAMNSN